MKPKCEHETVKCLEAKARWYKDSIEYNIRDTTEIIDSIKQVIDKYKTEKQGLQKQNNLLYLTSLKQKMFL